mmetsp:Transcript_3058/g.5342  ORF Transcript_3058/g.5342 Transcript_3058/m.5342 type:complete len:293 (+) Transcript_3058:423-1301(+)
MNQDISHFLQVAGNLREQGLGQELDDGGDLGLVPLVEEHALDGVVVPGRDQVARVHLLGLPGVLVGHVDLGGGREVKGVVHVALRVLPLDPDAGRHALQPAPTAPAVHLVLGLALLPYQDPDGARGLDVVRQAVDGRLLLGRVFASLRDTKKVHPDKLDGGEVCEQPLDMAQLGVLRVVRMGLVRRQPPVRHKSNLITQHATKPFGESPLGVKLGEQPLPAEPLLVRHQPVQIEERRPVADVQREGGRLQGDLGGHQVRVVHVHDKSFFVKEWGWNEPLHPIVAVNVDGSQR